MKVYKKHILIGVICLASVLLQSMVFQSVTIISTVIPYLTFCICSLIVTAKSKNVIRVLTVLSAGLVLLPFLDFVYYIIIITDLLPPNLAADVLLLLLKIGTYFALFIFINSWICKEKFSFSLITGVFVAVCIALYVAIEVLQILIMISVINQAVGGGTIFHWAAVVHGTPTLDILSKTAFYAAVWGTSIRFVK